MGNEISTVTFREKLAEATAGNITLPQASQIAFGNGGHDTSGQPVDPTGTETSVPGEFLQKSLNTITFTGATTELEGLLDFTEGNGEEVSAVGIYDADGDLMALKTFTPKNKDSETSIPVYWNMNY